MKVLGLTLDDTSHAPILLLQEEAGKELLPIWIGAMEAMAISLALGKVPVDRPLTHDLIVMILRNLSIRIHGVELTDLREGTYYADLVLGLQNGQSCRIGCRPSDAVALALRVDAPIRASRHVLQLAAAGRAGEGATPGEPQQAAQRAGGTEQERLFDLLRSLEPESKRKM